VTLRVGDRVLFTKFSGTEINIPDFSTNQKPETLIVLRENEVLAAL
jgi:co-chaperonin GroES (HSP10)